MHQLTTLVSLLEILNKKHNIAEVYFQDPHFNEVETSFLSSLGYTVLQTPEIYDKMTPNTFLFALHLPVFLTARCVKICIPALYVGKDPEFALDLMRRSPYIWFAEPKLTKKGPIRETLIRFRDFTSTRKFPAKLHELGLASMCVRWMKEEEAKDTPAEVDKKTEV